MDALADEVELQLHFIWLPGINFPLKGLTFINHFDRCVVVKY